ncbi:MAG: hypothetical protein U0441_10690 [Polyangiaceae bacterium]
MASFSWTRWGAALGGALLGVAACQPEDSGSFGPPQGAGGLAVGGAGGGNTTATGGGMTTASGGGGAAPIPNFCECTYELVSDTGCGSCANATSISTGACYDVLTKCQAVPDCVNIISTCPHTCQNLSPSKRADCVSACLLPFGGDTAHDLAAAYLACTCQACASPCGGAPSIACQ